MCGIAGYFSKSDHLPAMQILKKMQESLVSRGPDGQGEYFHKSYGVVHTRLSIIDIDNGDQPLKNDKGHVLVSNGEIYNDLEIRSQCESESYFSDSDNESILTLYNLYGLSFVRHIRGMYSFALYDSKEETLILSRDPFGIKPLYVLETNTAVWFSSQPGTFINSGLAAKEENMVAKNNLFGLQFIPGNDTLINRIKRVSPGETLVLKNGKIIKRSFIDKFDYNNYRYKDPVSSFDKLWSDTLEKHQRSDVPIGIFFSGGIDSTAILAGMVRLGNNSISTYTAGYDIRSDLDERDKAERLAKLFGVKNKTVEINYNDFFTTLPQIINCMDDPVADYAIIPTYLLAKKVSSDVKVILSGEGGDELLAGYGRYRYGLRPWPFKKKPWSKHIFRKTDLLIEDISSWNSPISLYDMNYSKEEKMTDLQKLQFLDLNNWLSNDLLVKLDRCLMTHSIEGRVPFLDRPIATFLFNLPDEYKIKNNLGKWLIRLWLDKFFPQSEAFNKKKGFSVPVREWMAFGGSKLGYLVANQAGVETFCKKEKVIKLFENLDSQSAFAAWVLLFYAIWHQCHIIGIDPNANIFEVLSQKN